MQHKKILLSFSHVNVYILGRIRKAVGFTGFPWRYVEGVFFGILKEIVQLYICLHTNIKKKTLVITQIHVISYD